MSSALNSADLVLHPAWTLDFGSPWLAFWLPFTRLGEIQVLLPLAAVAALGLWACPLQRGVVKRWLMGFGLAFSITTVSKVMFLGFGLGIAAWDFTGFSGHAMSAASVLPLLAWLGAQALGSTAARRSVLAAAYALAALIAISRLPVGAHSLSESLTGFLLGMAASGYALWGAVGAPDATPAGSSRRVLRRSAGLAVLMLGVLTVAPWVSPPTRSHQWVTTLSLKMSGRPAPYTRHQLHRRAALEAALARAAAGLPTPLPTARPAR